jgi:hypothetical protein
MSFRHSQTQACMDAPVGMSQNQKEAITRALSFIKNPTIFVGF